jgi:hypothetical protein
MTMVDNFEFPWQPEDPIPWEARSFDFTDNNDDRFVTADVTYYNAGGNNPKPWKVYASIYWYQTRRRYRLRDVWFATADEAKAAAEAHIREHAS